MRVAWGMQKKDFGSTSRGKNASKSNMLTGSECFFLKKVTHGLRLIVQCYERKLLPRKCWGWDQPTKRIVAWHGWDHATFRFLPAFFFWGGGDMQPYVITSSSWIPISSFQVFSHRHQGINGIIQTCSKWGEWEQRCVSAWISTWQSPLYSGHSSWMFLIHFQRISWRCCKRQQHYPGTWPT